MTWAECKAEVDGFQGAKYKKFETKETAANFIQDSSEVKIQQPVSEEPDYYVYTDGACSNNGKDTAVAGLGIYFGPNDPRNVSQRLDGKQTNNAAELTAILQTYSLIENDLAAGKIVGLVSDSEYAIRCVTTYGKKCMEDGWKKDIPNKDLVKKTFELYNNTSNVRFFHVIAHTCKSDRHSLGNEAADILARKSLI